MTILRIHKKQNNFVILDKTCLHDVKISWAAKGLHGYLISMPDNWSVRVGHLIHQATNGRDSVRKLLIELQNAGYIQKSLKRDPSTGRFDCAEYLVLENPLELCEEEVTVTENQSPVKTPGKPTMAENPAPAAPASENPLLINNKIINNKKINNKTTTSDDVESATSQVIQEVAAVVSLPSVSRLSSHDAVIGDALTPSQKQRVLDFVDNLDVNNKESLVNEVEFCLLNSKHFSGCGNDFSRKLNAIRSVILRGDWCTPAGMLNQPVESSKNTPHKLLQLQDELRAAYAEANHFKRLLSQSSSEVRGDLEKILNQSIEKIKCIEEQIDVEFMCSIQTA